MKTHARTYYLFSFDFLFKTVLFINNDWSLIDKVYARFASSAGYAVSILAR